MTATISITITIIIIITIFMAVALLGVKLGEYTFRKKPCYGNMITTLYLRCIR